MEPTVTALAAVAAPPMPRNMPAAMPASVKRFVFDDLSIR